VTSIAVILAVVLLGSLAACLYVWQVEPRKRRRAIVNLKSGRSFEAVIWSSRGRYLALRDASLLTGQMQQKVDGEVVIAKTDIEFVQYP
jgi:hypothetical protein